SVLGVDEFTDAAAVEFPAQAASSVPSICMGQTDGGVNIWQWRASGQDGLPTSIEDLSPTGYVDRYPSTEGLYFPAREAGNPVAQSSAVQDLVAVGFGTLTPAVDQGVAGMAMWEDDRWSVVFARELSPQAAEQAELGVGVSVDIAFAVWDGSEGERNGVKSVSQFVVLDLSSEGFQQTTTKLVLIAVGVVAGLFILVVVVGTVLERSVERAAADSTPPSSA
ncbi:MAG: ethylbenzene dehydrogenase-related protein, partial [Acidimicrobiia bacterium]|nr:ethylbenzene dehydrogenase-related protein [Acidimicrobiia bacterium]